jgi:hypothetical protein
MAARNRRPSKLDPYLDKVGVIPDREIAEIAGVTSENVRAYRKRRGIPAGWRGETADQVSKPGKPTKRPRKSAKSAKPRKSKLDPYMDKVGVLPDAEVAAVAGVSAENVRAYRKRRGIPAGWRGEGAVAKPAAAKPAAPRRPGSPRRGKLTPYREQVGILTDSQVAKLADTAAQNVRAYRLRHGIPARWRGEGQPLPNEEAILALYEGQQAVTQAPAVPEPLPPEPEDLPAAVPQPMGLEGYAITVKGDDEEIRYVVMADDIAQAALKAVQGVARRGIEGRIVSVRFLARTLQG